MPLPIAGFLQSFKLPRYGIISGKTWLGFALLVATAFGQTVTADFDARSGNTHYIPSGMFGVNGAALNDPTALKTLSLAGLTETRKVVLLSRVYATSDPDWSTLDWEMRLTASAGLHPLLSLQGSPSWLQPSPNPCVGTKPDFAAPRNIAEWAQLAATYVAHLDATFPGLVHNYEIWNEPELPQSFCVAGGTDAIRLTTYLALYGAAASAMRAQATRDGVKISIGGPVISNLSLAPEWIPALLSDPATAANVDFVSYHMYLTGLRQIATMNWSDLYAATQSTTRGAVLHYVKNLTLVNGVLPKPIYVTEFNDNWAFEKDCCRNHPTFGPLWNSVAIVDFLNTVYAGASRVPTKFFYFAGSAPPYFCIVGTWNSTMDCNPSKLQLYPQFYAYELLASPAYLGLSKGGHMARSASPVNTQSGLLATAFYTSAKDVVVVVNPTATAVSSVKVTANHAGFSTAAGKLYILNRANPNITSKSLSLTKITGGYTATISVPAYSTVAVAIAP
jgi:Glycosyl hydrolases family 39